MTEQCSIKLDPERDVLVEKQRFRDMVRYVEFMYPKISKEIFSKILDITPYEVKSLEYTGKQYFDLKSFCIKHDFNPDEMTVERAIVGDQMPVDREAH